MIFGNSNNSINLERSIVGNYYLSMNSFLGLFFCVHFVYSVPSKTREKFLMTPLSNISKNESVRTLV